MLETTTLRDPALLRLVAFERRPAVLAGFVDAAELEIIKDMAVSLVVHDGLASLDMDDEGAARDMLAALLDAEAEDPVEGDKHLLVLRNAPLDQVATIAASFPAGWVATTPATAADAARRLGVPVLDVRSGTWVNVDVAGMDLAWARLLLSYPPGTPFRMALREFLTSVMLVASAAVSGDEGEAARLASQKFPDPVARRVLATILPSRFGIDPACIGDGPTAMESPPPPSTVQAPHPSFAFFSENAAFKRAFVKVLERERGPAGGGTTPAATFDTLRAGPWRDGIPCDVLEAMLSLAVAGSKTTGEARATATAFQQAIDGFGLASKEVVTIAVTRVLDQVALPSTAPAASPGPRCRWTGLPPPPGPGGDVVAWIDLALRKQRAWVSAVSGILARGGVVAPEHPAPFVPPARPQAPVERWTGDQACTFLSVAMPAMMHHVAAIGASMGVTVPVPVFMPVPAPWKPVASWTGTEACDYLSRALPALKHHVGSILDYLDAEARRP